jgi:rhodanese-related sulfurtransferase
VVRYCSTFVNRTNGKQVIRAQAIHIPLADLADHLAELPSDHLIVCVCRSGHRSLRAAHFLSEGGFEVANLEGGMTAWQLAGEPLVGDNGEPSIQ